MIWREIQGVNAGIETEYANRSKNLDRLFDLLLQLFHRIIRVIEYGLVFNSVLR